MSSSTPLIAAHRGASKAERENTLAAFRLAESLGADMVELDVRLSADQHLVVHHDAVVEGLGPIVELRAADLPPHVPTLAESLEACGAMHVNIEIKSDRDEPGYDTTHRLTRLVVELLAADPRKGRYIVSSFDRSVIDLYKELDPAMATGFLYSVSARPGRVIDACVRDGHQAIHPYHVPLIRRTVEQASEAGLAVNVWTVDDPDRMRALASWGVSALITNVPDVARVALRSHLRP
jgi:glycerophosphoryl diester phosphodiesterase